jgi:hypothetical protein
MPSCPMIGLELNGMTSVGRHIPYKLALKVLLDVEILCHIRYTVFTGA